MEFTKTILDALKHWVNGKISNIEKALEGKQPSGDYALKSEIPSLEGIATEEYVESMLGQIVYVEWDVNNEYEIAPSPAGDALVKLSDEVPSSDSIIGATATITLTADGETTAESRVVTADMIVETDYGYVYGYSESSGIYFVTAESATIADTVLTRGVWCQNLAKMSGYVEFKIFKEFVTPKVATAQVGQTIVVKAVDENGKPVEWEAVDMPTDEHINALIDAKLEAIENGTY